MTTLRLAIDASGMRTGAQDAVRVLEDVKRTAVDTGKALEQSFTFSRGNRIFVPDRLYEPVAKSAREAGAAAVTMGRGFGVANEALSIGNRVRLLTTEFAYLAAGMGSASTASLLLAQGLLDVSQIAARVRQIRLANEIAGAGGAFSTLFALIRANPLLTIVTALGAATAAMSLFGNSTDKAAESTEKLADAVRQLQQTRLESEALGRIGFGAGGGSGFGAEARRLSAEGVRIREAGERVSLPQLAELLGVRESTITDRLGRDAVAYERRQGEFGRTISAADAQEVIEARARMLQFSEATEQATQKLRQFQEAAPQPTVDTFGGSLPQFGPTDAEAQRSVEARAQLDAYVQNLRAETELLGQNEQVREQNLAVMQAQAIAQEAEIELSADAQSAIREQIALQQQLIELRQLGTDVGQAVGGALFSIVSGANSARQAVAQLVQQFILLAQQRFVQQFGALTGQAFAATGTQAATSGTGGTNSVGITSGQNPYG